MNASRIPGNHHSIALFSFFYFPACTNSFFQSLGKDHAGKGLRCFISFVISLGGGFDFYPRCMWGQKNDELWAKRWRYITCSWRIPRWHVQYKQDKGKDYAYLLFDHRISFLTVGCTHKLIVLFRAFIGFLFFPSCPFHCFLSLFRDLNQRSNVVVYTEATMTHELIFHAWLPSLMWK